MCRSAIEFPPNGKRCGHGDHLSVADQTAWKVKRAARERELYYIRKERKAGDAENNTVEPDVNADSKNVTATNFHEVVDSLIENHNPGVPVNNFSAVYAKKYGSLVNISKDPSALAAGSALDDDSISHEQSRNIAAYILSSEQPELAYMEITGEDEDFYADSVNEVSRVILEDGSIGYFKNYKAATWDSGTQNDYGHDVLQTFNNEVVAYRLSQIMGDGYSDLVPVTVLREYNGQLGSLQAEADGVVGAHTGWADFYRECSYSQLRKAALFDYIAGSQDRHAYNYAVVDKGRDGKDELVLIDNGFSFPSEEHAYKNSLKISAMMMDASNDEGIDLTVEEQGVVEKVRASMKEGELSNLLSKEQKAYMTKRIDLLMETKKLDRDNYSAFMGIR